MLFEFIFEEKSKDFNKETKKLNISRYYIKHRIRNLYLFKKIPDFLQDLQF